MDHEGDDVLNPAGDAEPPVGESSAVVEPIGPLLYECPHCSQPVEIGENASEPFIHCLYCGNQFAVASSESADQEYESREADARAAESESALDGARIHQLTSLRRGAIRARTYLHIGWVVCATGGVQLTLKAMQRVRYEHVWDSRTFAFGIFSVVCFMISLYFLKRALEIGRELKTPLLEEPTTPPDFSTLSDGSQHARNLDDIR